MLQVVSDLSLTNSGVHRSRNKNSDSFQNQLSKEASDAAKAEDKENRTIDIFYHCFNNALQKIINQNILRD